MSKLRSIGYKEFVRKLIKGGYIAIRKSKHIIYYHREKQITIPIPHKHSRDIQRGLLNKLVKEMKITSEEFNKL